MSLFSNPITVLICYTMASFDDLYVLRYFMISKIQTVTKLQQYFKKQLNEVILDFQHYTINNIHICQYRII